MPITHLTTPDDHDAVVARAHAGTPTVLYVCFTPSPACKTFTPAYEQLAEEFNTNSPAGPGGASGKSEHNDGLNAQVEFYQMEYGSATSPMMKFGPQNMPVLVVLVGQRARTLLRPRLAEVKAVMEEVFWPKNETI